MKIIQAGRRGGKTTQAILWLAGGKDRILLTGEREASRLRCEYPVFAAQIYDFTINVNGALRARNAEIGIDNLDAILAAGFGQAVAFATVGDGSS